MAKYYATGTQKINETVVNESGKKEKVQGTKSVLITFENVLPPVNSRLRAENVAREYGKLNGVTGIEVFVVQGTNDKGYIMPTGKNKLANRIKAQRQAELKKTNKGKK